MRQLASRADATVRRYNAMDRSSLIVAAALGALVIALVGCGFNRQQINHADLPERVAGVVPGRTTLAQLEEMAGGPATAITPVGDKRLYTYTFGDAKTKGLYLILLNISKTNSGIDTASFLVNQDNIVEATQVGKNSENLPWEWWAFGD
jgi:hypothetical protein